MCLVPGEGRKDRIFAAKHNVQSRALDKMTKKSLQSVEKITNSWQWRTSMKAGIWSVEENSVVSCVGFQGQDSSIWVGALRLNKAVFVYWSPYQLHAIELYFQASLPNGFKDPFHLGAPFGFKLLSDWLCRIMCTLLWTTKTSLFRVEYSDWPCWTTFLITKKEDLIEKAGIWRSD